MYELGLHLKGELLLAPEKWVLLVTYQPEGYWQTFVSSQGSLVSAIRKGLLPPP
jgi:hypothetical protein